MTFADVAKVYRSRIAEYRHRAAQILLEEALKRAPVDSGALRNSGKIEDVSEFESQVSFPIFYAYFVEFGTKQHAPNPFFRQAVVASRPRIEKLALDIFGKK